MEIFQTIWTALTTPNELLTKILVLPLAFVETTVMMLLFTTILDIKTTKKQKLIYIAVMAILTIISNTFIPKSYGMIINLILTPILIKFLLKTSWSKSIVAEFIPLIVTVLLETIIVRIFLILFNVSYEETATIPIFRLVAISIMYLIVYLLHRLAKYFNFNITLIDTMNRKEKLILLLNCILAIVAIGTQFYLIQFYNDNLPFVIILLSMLSLITYFLMSLYSLTGISRLAITTRDLEETKQYNKTLGILYDNIKAFKHDFANIVQAMGRLC